MRVILQITIPHSHTLVVHLLLYPITCCAFYDDIIGIPPVRQFASLPARSGFVDQAHYHRNMNLRVLDVLMPICYTIYGRHTHSHTHPILRRVSSSRMRHSEYADWVEKYWEWEQFHFFGGEGRKESLVRRLFCRVAQQKHGNTNSRTKPHSDNEVLQAL